MASNFFKVKKGLNLDSTTAASTASAEGDLNWDATNHKIEYKDNSAVRKVVSEDGTQTLANKTIDASSNTLSNVVGTTVTTTATNSTNASFFPTFVAAGTSGNQAVDTATGLTFNPSTNTLSTTTFSGALSGNATTSTTATNATNTAITDDTTTNATMFPTWVTTASSNQAQKVSSSKLTFNPSTATLATTTFSGALSGNATTSTTATNATNVATTATSSNASFFPLFVASSSNGNQAASLHSSITINPSTEALTVRRSLFGYATLNTSGGTSNLSNGTSPNIEFTGSNTETVVLPDATTLAAGWNFNFYNSSSGTVTIQDGGTTTLTTMTPSSRKSFFLTNAGSVAGTWLINNYSSSSSSSGINYINNPNAETDTTGWATYADVAGTSPVDGTGGSPTTTWTRSTSSPLRGTGSFLLTKDAANRQGEGASYDFTIDSADQAKPIAITFDYTVGSGTYADGDLTVWLYDKTNTTLIPPAPSSIHSVVAGTSQKWSGYFQTSSASTSYRLIVHVTTTSASAYTVKFDNFSVGSTYQSYGAVTTDWTAYTPSLTSSGGGAVTLNSTGKTSPNGYWRRVGDSAEIIFSYRNGSGGGATGNAGSVYVSLPSGITIDSTKIETGVAGGPVYGVCATNATNYNGLVIDNGATTSVRTTDGLGTTTTVAILVASFGIDARFMVPVSGWSSNVQVSSDTDTRVVSVVLDGSGSTITNSSGDVITPTTIAKDTHGAFSGSTFTVPVPGYYQVNGYMAAGSVSYTAGNAIALTLFKNGANYQNLSVVRIARTATDAYFASGSATLFCNAGDTLVFRGTSSTSATLSDFHGSIFRLSGPSQIAASESVNARYTDAAGQSIVTGTIYNWATKDYDSHNAVTTGASWKFTAPMAGKYRINCRWITGAATAASVGNLVGLRLSKNGGGATAYVAISYAIITGSIAKQSSGATTVNLVAGDTISLLGLNNTGQTNTTDASADENFIEIERVGN